MDRSRNPDRTFTNVFGQPVPFFSGRAVTDALFHLCSPQLAQNAVRFFEHQGTEFAFRRTRGRSAAQVAFECQTGIILLDHAVGTGRHTITAAVALAGIHHDNTPFVFKDGLLRACLLTIRLGALKTDARHGIAMQGEVVDLKPGLGRHEHALLDRRTGVSAPIAARAAIRDGQKMLFHSTSGFYDFVL